LNENSTDRRDKLMAALSAAEHFVATTPVIPNSVDVSDDLSISVYMHERPEDVAAAADAAELALSLRTDHGGAGRPYVQGKGSVQGVSVRVWALGDADEQERYAACVPVSGEAAPGVDGMPSEWHAAGAV
jgi:hypothetical protein